MKRKKVLSMAVVSALIAAQMAMPVMAADGGSLDVEVTTQSGVLRVEVPTTMSIAVDQFEIGNEGAQIAVAAPFTMSNKSEMNVRVEVTSTADLGTGISLVSSKAAAGSSTKDEAWLAVAAQVAAGQYDAAASNPKDSWDLADTDDNVATFGSDKMAKQTFYLEKATGAVSYKLAVPDANGKVGESFAKFYELTPIDTATGGNAEDILTAEAAKGDLYTIATTDIAKDKAALTVIPKETTIVGAGDTPGTGEVAHVADNTYYKAATVASNPTTGKVYAYASLATASAGGDAAFTYIGKLSNAKETWTADDIKKISIAYTITGVTETKYNQVKTNCTYGLYTPVKPTIATKTYSVTANTAFDVTVTLGSATKVSSAVLKGDSSLELLDGTGTFATYSEADGKLKLTAALATFITNNPTVTLDVVFDDGTVVTLNFTV